MSKFKVAILGNLNETYEPHYMMNKAFADFQQSIDFSFEWIPTENLADNTEGILESFQGIVAGSGPYKSKEGVINGIRFARKNNIPFIGTCSGFGYAVLEFGQSIFNLSAVYHPYEGFEMRADETFLQPLNACSAELYTINFAPVNGTLTNGIFNIEVVDEISHCAYGISSRMIDIFEREGFIVAGRDEAGEPKIMEYNRNDFFVITLFYPQMKSTLSNPHPLINAFFQAVEQQVEQQ